MDLSEQPTAFSVLEDHRHPVRVPRNVVLARHDLGSLGEKPCNRSRRDVVAVPLPRIRRLTVDVAVQEAPQLGESTKHRLLRGDHNQVEDGSTDAKHRIGIPASKRRAEVVQDLDQLSFVRVVGIQLDYLGTNRPKVDDSLPGNCDRSATKAPVARRGTPGWRSARVSG